MPELDLTNALGLRVGNVDALALRIANVDVWTAPVPVSGLMSTFGDGEPPVIPSSWSDANPGSWLTQQWYCANTGESFASGKIVGARLYLPPGSPHIGQSWKAALHRDAQIISQQDLALPFQEILDSSGTDVTGAPLVAGWNEVSFAIEYPGVANGRAFFIGVMIGDGTRYVHDSTLTHNAIPVAGNVYLSDYDVDGNRCFYRDFAVNAMWYGIDCLIRI